MTTYANRVTAKYLELRAAREAGGAPIDFLAGTLVVGDSGAAGAPPTLTDLVAANGVLHEVWRGAVVVSCAPNATDDTQIDIGVAIPAAIGGHEVGPFQINEFALLDAAGHCLVVGQMNAYKGTAATGLPGDLAFIVQIGASASDVVISPPGSSIFITEVDVRTAINAHQPTGDGAILQTDTTVAGWLRRVFTLRKARQPSAVVGAVVAEADAFGGGRPATDAEFDAGAAADGSSFVWPWPTLQQIKAAIGTLTVYGALFPLIKNATAKRYEIANATVGAVGAVRLATSGEVVARATNPTIGGPCAVRPEDIPVVADPWGVGLGAIIRLRAYATYDGLTAGPSPTANLIGKTMTAAEIKAGKAFADCGLTIAAMRDPATVETFGTSAPAAGSCDARYSTLVGTFVVVAYELSAWTDGANYTTVSHQFVVTLKRSA